MNDYDLLVNYLQEQHNEVFHQWANVKEQLDILEQDKQLVRQTEELERKKPKILDLANWCDVNRIWLESLSDSDNIKAIQLSVELMVEALYDEDLSLIGACKTAIRTIGSNIPEFHVVGYLKDGKRVITPFNHCYYHNHGDDVKFDSNTEYDWREEE